MTSESTNQIPSSLRHQDVERGNPNTMNRVPIRFLPSKKEEDDDTTNVVKVKLDKDGELFETVKKHGGNATNEETIIFVQRISQILQNNGYKKEIDDVRAAHMKLLEDKELKEQLRPTVAEEGILTDDSDAADSDDEESSDEENPLQLQGSRNRTKITRLAKYEGKIKELDAKIKQLKKEEAELVLKCLYLVGRVLESDQAVLFKRCTSEVVNTTNWTDDEGVVHPEKMGFTWESFVRIRLEYVLLTCPRDSAEVEKEYLRYRIHLHPNVTLKALYNRVMQINSYFEYLPCLKDSKAASPDMPRMNVPLKPYELCQVLMNAMPQSWQSQYYLNHDVVPSDHVQLRDDLEKIERNAEQQKRKVTPAKGTVREKKKAKASPVSGQQSDKDDTNPNQCKNCKKFGGPFRTHATKDCYKFDSKGNRLGNSSAKSKAGKERGVSKANFAQLQKIDSLEKKVKKLEKKRKASRKERRRKVVYEDSSSDSDSE